MSYKDVSYKDGNELILKTVKWMKNATNSITRAGGDASSVMNKIPEEVLITLIRNDLHIAYIHSV